MSYGVGEAESKDYDKVEHTIDEGCRGKFYRRVAAYHQRVGKRKHCVTEQPYDDGQPEFQQLAIVRRV